MGYNADGTHKDDSLRFTDDTTIKVNNAEIYIRNSSHLTKSRKKYKLPVNSTKVLILPKWHNREIRAVEQIIPEDTDG